ncbi:MAG: IPT/TIG domain-containing protein, partial [Christensenellales bacterium]
MKKIRIIISMALTMALLMSACPGYPPTALAEGSVQITHVFIERTDNEVLETAKGVIEIDGNNLKDVMVRVRTTAGGGSKILGVDLGKRVTNENTYLKFELTGAEMKSIILTDGINIGGLMVAVDDSNFPTINSVEPKVVCLGANQLTINGSNLDKDSLTFGNGTFNGGSINRTPGNITVSDLSGDTGFHDIIFTRVNTGVANLEPGGTVTIRRLYQNQFRTVQQRVFEGLEMYPNKGVPQQTRVYFRAPNLEESSVFFLRDIDDPYYVSNLGTDYHYQSNADSDNIITVKVPNLTPGTYQVLLTNHLSNPPAGTDLRGLVKWQQAVGRFLVVSASEAAQIVRVEPNQGPNRNKNKVTIIGQNFDELLIDGLTLNNPDQIPDIQVSDDDQKSLVIDYGEGTYDVGTGSKNVQVKRSIKVFIGDETELQPADQQEFSGNYDNLRVFTPLLNDDQIQNDPHKDVVVELTTTLTVQDATAQEYRFMEQALLEKGFLYIKSYTAPTLTEVIPNSIPVVETNGNYETREDMVISIIGKDFMVNKFTDLETVTEYVYYPLVNLGGVITLKREGKNADDVLIKDVSGFWNRYQGASVEVLHDTTLIDGTAGKEVGNRLVIRIPVGIQVSNDCLNATHLEITNPMKKSGDYGYPIRQDDMLKFVLVGDNGPTITSVEPHVVSTEGEKGVEIKGSNFQVGVRVFIDGLEVNNIKRTSLKDIIFDAPPGREGETRLIVMNPNGEADSAQFIYVKTQTNPRITSISPTEGTIGTLAVISGEGFLGPDPTATPAGMGIYRLLGARVLFDNEDKNEYRYREGSNSVIEPQGYRAPAGQELLRVENNHLILADYYPSILLRNSEGRYSTISKNNSQQPVLSDGAQEWTFAYNGTDITASDKSGNLYEVSLGVNGDHDQLTLTRNGSVLVFAILTAYKVDSNNIIVGHRAKVVDGGKRIMVTIPNLQVQKSYDITVINPDTKRDTINEGFYFYLSPQRIPVIKEIIPNRGSTAGGYYIDIKGEDFEHTDTIQTRVFIDGVEIPAADTIVSTDLKSIRVKVPPYNGDLGKDLGVAFKAVPVVVLNPSDGGSSGWPEGFTYMVPTSQPFIDNLTVTEGTAAGGDYVQIIGRDFRLYEPYQDLNNNFRFDPDVDIFSDINGNGQWDDLRQWANLEDIKNEVSDEDQVNKLIQVLPRVYFGSKEAQVTDFSSNFLVVVTPASQPGNVSVYIVNNDYGVSNSKAFTFKGSSPKIQAVIPDVGRRQGGEIVEIHGSGLQEATIKIVEPDGTTQGKTMPLVRFGSLEGTGTVLNGRVTNLDAGGYLKINYNTNSDPFTLSMSLQTVAGHVYQQNYVYDGGDCFIDLSQLADSSGQAYGSQELVRLQVILDNEQGYRMQVQRGFAPEATLVSPSQIRVTTPPYYTVGKVALSVINPDGSVATGSFTYRNPDSKPRITSIIRDDQSPVLTEIEGRQVKILRMNYQGSSQVKVFGQDFRENAIIKVGTLFTIQPDQILYTLPDQLAFTMPDVPESEVGKLHRVVVINEDGGSAASDQPVSGLPADEIYLQFTKGETEPGVDVISPIKGPASGGTRIKIEGKDFRTAMQGYDNKNLKVFLGGQEATAVEVADYRTIWATTPASKPGTVMLRVENPDGEISNPL